MRELAELASRLAEIERRMAASNRQGTVTDVDAAGGKVRLSFGDGDAGDFLSPWVTYAQTGGALKVHSPPSVGQQFTLMAPSGDMKQGIALPLGFSDSNPSPSASPDDHVMALGDVLITANASGLTIAVGGVTVVIDGAGLTVTGGLVSHDGKDIGATHTHGGITPGGASTAVPN